MPAITALWDIDELLVQLHYRSRTSLYAFMRRHPGFPRPIALGNATATPRWRSADVIHWLNQQPVVDVVCGVPAPLRRKMIREAEAA